MHSIYRHHLPFSSLLAFLLVFSVHCNLYKVGDLHCWGVPSRSNLRIYSSWAEQHHFHIGDSLMFLYPPSQDSVVQVTESAFNTCSTADPLLKLHDGNSVFNFTSPGMYYYISGIPGHCDKHQKLAVAVLSADGSSDSSDNGGAPAASPSYPVVFGPTTASPSSSPSKLLASYLTVGSGMVGSIIGTAAWI